MRPWFQWRHKSLCKRFWPMGWPFVHWCDDHVQVFPLSWNPWWLLLSRERNNDLTWPQNPVSPHSFSLIWYDLPIQIEYITVNCCYYLLLRTTQWLESRQEEGFFWWKSSFLGLNFQFWQMLSYPYIGTLWWIWCLSPLYKSYLGQWM